MITPDIINCLFEFAGGYFIVVSILQLLKDKRVEGVNWQTPAFFSSWAWWNIYFYPHLDQWWSAVAAAILGVANTTWFVMLLYYKKHPGGKK